MGTQTSFSHKLVFFKIKVSPLSGKPPLIDETVLYKFNSRYYDKHQIESEFQFKFNTNVLYNRHLVL